MDFISVHEAAEKWGITKRRVQILCLNNRIPGVERIGNMWIIPKGTEKPKDARIKTTK